ncbi:hypothetical protein [Pleionea mediterranea]|uniref:Outer membrane protein with beta-barrel domain n=1 Tax=Pleionea mediterranea TaxID=523701 RepID=A0A316F9X8_9GAMM|nr:hypothetical protein [Pleionea mediterranea]PWK43588.1 hypothetical protein C8D97_1162 [Pleionea mediterranea]
MNKLICSAGLLIASSLISANDNISFDYLQAGYSTVELESLPGDPSEFTGYSIAGSYKWMENVFIAGEYNSTSDIGVDVNYSKLGVGYIHPLENDMSMFLQANYIVAELGSRLAGDFDDKGFSVEAGLRALLTDSFELKGVVEFQRDADMDRNYVVLGGNYNFNSSLSAYIDYKTESDSDIIVLGARYNF